VTPELSKHEPHIGGSAPTEQSLLPGALRHPSTFDATWWNKIIRALQLKSD